MKMVLRKISSSTNRQEIRAAVDELDAKWNALGSPDWYMRPEEWPILIRVVESKVESIELYDES